MNETVTANLSFDDKMYLTALAYTAATAKHQSPHDFMKQVDENTKAFKDISRRPSMEANIVKGGML